MDEYLHESLVDLAHAAGFAAMHVNHLGLSGRPDWLLAERIIEEEFMIELHPGLIVLVPNVVPALQRALFQAALQYAAAKDLTNTVIEVSLDGKTVLCVEYRLPAP